uniref:Somatostatin 1, tandem duplicate 2 n=1 Tax=Tetraodon nigroviridis TaxID=99883 RepID=H3BXT6_TETNG
MPGVRSSTILVLTALVLSIQAVSSQPDRDLDQNQDLDQEVLFTLGVQEMSRSSLADLLLSDLLQVENQALDENFPLVEGEPEEVHVDMERAADAGIGPFLTPRERKAGCKNFFWKTFTSC